MKFLPCGVALKSSLAVLAVLICPAIHASLDPTLNVTLTKANQNVVLKWFGHAGAPYQIESSSDLVAWTNSGPVITGSNANCFVTNSISGVGLRFYRVSRLFPAANNSAAFNPATGLLTIVGDDNDNTIVIGLNGDDITVNGGAIPINGGSATVSNTVLIQALGRGGNDQLIVSGALPPTHLFGDDGNDTFVGGFGAELFVGGPGDDFVDGNGGDDNVYLGEGNDTFQWDPGDGNDVIDGGPGKDTLTCNGSSAAETFNLSSFLGLVFVSRDVGAVLLSMDRVERIDLSPRTGADNITVANLAGTTITELNLDLTATSGSNTPDVQADTVTLLGTADPETIHIGTNGNAMEVTGFAVPVRVVNGEAALDSIFINGSGNDFVNINGSPDADTMTATVSGTSARVGVTGFSTSVTVSSSNTLSINGLGGPDTISCIGNFVGTGISLILDGGDGDDTIFGSNSNDLILAGDGNDFADGNQGSDTIYLGEGDDTAQWDPGDTSDIIEGQGGFDTLIFNGSAVGENITLSASSSRFRFFRDVGSVTLDVDGLERVTVQPLGGADNIIVSNLVSTAVTQVNVNFSGSFGPTNGDVQLDAVTIYGTTNVDTLNIATNAGAVEVNGLAAQVRILNGEVGFDSIVFTGIGGDTVNINGSTTNDTMTVTANGIYARADVAGFGVGVNVNGALSLSMNGLDGDDTITCIGNLAGVGIPLTLNGGDGNDTILGSNGNDLLLGGKGDDLVDGNQGSDTAYLGEGNDTFQWDPGDASDVVEGEGGIDKLVFNGASAGENITLSAVGSRLRFMRDIGGVTLDVDGVETASYQALGGADNVTVNNLAGTTVTQVNIDLAGMLGGNSTDGQLDTVTVNGTENPDAINIKDNGGTVEVSGLPAQVRILHPDVFDSLIANGLGVTDTFNVTSALMNVITNQ